MTLTSFILSILASIIAGLILWKYSHIHKGKTNQIQFGTRNSKQSVTLGGKSGNDIDQKQTFTGSSDQKVTEK